jgi:DNA gyrase/topoisomerase IV subunit A
VINKRDPAEWLAQIEQQPDSAPYVVRMLLARLQTLDQENERLRNNNIELRDKIDTRAHQTEVNELKRQMKALSRLVAVDAHRTDQQRVLIVWSRRGDILTVDPSKHDPKRPIPLPPTWQEDAQWRLSACVPQDEILVVTRSGQSTIFEVADLLRLSEGARDWHHIPGLRLTRDEFVAYMLPIGRLPLSDGIAALSIKGSGRKLSRWALDTMLQSGQFGKGVIEEWDWQAFGVMQIHPNSNVLAITSNGAGLRFPAESLGPGPAAAIRLESGDEVVEALTDDLMIRQIALIDASGRALRRPLMGLPPASIGTKGKVFMTTDSLVGAALVDDDDTLALLIGGSTTLTIQCVEASDIPLSDRAKPGVAVIDGPVIGMQRI